MASGDVQSDESLYPIAVLIDELRNEDVQVTHRMLFSVPRSFAAGLLVTFE